MTFEEPDGATLLDSDEMQGLKFPHVEQANVEQGLAWIARRRGGSVFDDGFIRTLHKRLFGDIWAWAGEYRLTEKNIGIDPFQIPVQLRSLLEEPYAHSPIVWASGFDLQPDSKRRDAYIAALRGGDGGNIGLLLSFVGVEE